MKIINIYSTNPFLNLAIEEIYLNDADTDTFLIWQNYNTIVVGRNQNTYSEINHDFVKEKNINVVRRLSGGGSVFHDKGNLNFTFIIKGQNKKDINFEKILNPIVNFLNSLNIKAIFSGRNDILVDGKKISGSSVYMKNDKILLHGTLLFDVNLQDLVSSLNVDKSKLQAKGIESIRSRVTNIHEYLENKDIDNFRKLLIEYIIVNYNANLENLDENIIIKAKEMAIKKYETFEWNFCNKCEYKLHNKKKYLGGILEIYTEVVDGLISGMRFFGDYIGLLPTKNIENEIIGTIYKKENVRLFLESIDLDLYFFGINIDNILEMIFKND